MLWLICSDESKKGDGISVYDCIEAFTQKETLRPTDAWYCPDCKKHQVRPSSAVPLAVRILLTLLPACSQCAEKKFDLYRLPDTLIIHLKRFNYNRVWRDKVQRPTPTSDAAAHVLARCFSQIDSHVDFPLENLNLAQWVVSAEEKKAAVYDLYAVSNHFGGLGGGACLDPFVRSIACVWPLDCPLSDACACAGHYTAYAKNLIDKKWYNLDDSSVGPVDRIQTPAAYVLFYHRKKPRFPEGACSVPQKKA